MCVPCLENEKWNLHAHLFDIGLKNLLFSNNKKLCKLQVEENFDDMTKATYEKSTANTILILNGVTQ